MRYANWRLWPDRPGFLPPIAGGATIEAKIKPGEWHKTGTWVGTVVPTKEDDVLITSASEASSTIFIETAKVAECRTLGCTGAKCAFEFKGTSVLKIGSTAGFVGYAFKGSSTMTLTASSTSKIEFVSTAAGAQTITTEGATMPETRFKATGSYVLEDNYKCLVSFFSQEGAHTINTNGNTVTSPAWGQTSTTSKLKFGASKIVLTGTGQIWNVATGTTVEAGTSVIEITNTSETLKKWTGGEKTYNQVIVASDNVEFFFNGSTFETLELNTRGKSVKGTIFGKSLVFNVTNFLTNATSSEKIKIKSSEAGKPWKLKKSSGTVTVEGVEISDSVAEGGATFLASTTKGNVDGGGNTGWNFAAEAAEGTTTNTTGGGKTTFTSYALVEGATATRGGGKTTFASGAVREGKEVTKGGGKTAYQSAATREGKEVTKGGGRTAFTTFALREGSEITRGGGKTTFTGNAAAEGHAFVTHGGGQTTIPIHERQDFLGWRNNVPGLGFTPAGRSLAYKVVATTTHVVNTVGFKTNNSLEPGNVAIMSDVAGKPGVVLREVAFPFKFAAGEGLWEFSFADLELTEGSTYYIVVNFVSESGTNFANSKPATIASFWGKHEPLKISEETEWEAKTLGPFRMWVAWQSKVATTGGGRTTFTSTATDVGREATKGGGRTTFISAAVREGSEQTKGGGRTTFTSAAERAGQLTTKGGGRTTFQSAALEQGQLATHGGGKTTYQSGALRQGIETTHGGGKTTFVGAIATAQAAITHGGGRTTFVSFAPREQATATHGGGRTTFTSNVAIAGAFITHGGGKTTYVSYALREGVESTRGGGRTAYQSFALRQGSLTTHGGGQTRFSSGTPHGQPFVTHGGGKTTFVGFSRINREVTHGGGRTIFTGHRATLQWISATAPPLSGFPVTVTPTGGTIATVPRATPFPATIGARDL